MSNSSMTVPALALAVLAMGCQNSAVPPGPSPVTTVSAAPTSALRIAGVVRDTLQRPVSGVALEVVEGAAAGRVAVTNGDGRFTLADAAFVPQIVTVQFRKDLFTPVTLGLRNNLTDAAIALVAADLVDLQGRYSITFAAASSCAQLAPAVRTRTYTGTIQATTSNRWVFTSDLSGATFHPGYSTFFGAVSGDAARFFVSSWDAYNWWLEDQPIIERIDSNTYVSFDGTATAMTMTSDNSIAATFDGSFSYCAAAKDPTTPNYPLTCGTPIIECKSAQHQLTLVRQRDP